MRDKLKIGERFKRYTDKFRKPIKVQQVKNKRTLGEILTNEVSETVNRRLNEIIPLIATGGCCRIQCNSGSFWELPRKQLTLFVLVEFDEDVKWKSEEDSHNLSELEKEKKTAA